MRSVCFALAAVVVAAPAAAQDPVKAAPSSYHVLAENERVRVLHATLPPGGKAAMHEHPAHVAVSLSDGTVRMTTGDGQTNDVAMKTGEVLSLPAGKHAPANPGAAAFEVIVIELKGAAGTATLPATRPGMKSTVLLDDARVRAVRVSFEPAFHEPAGSTHDFDQVVVMLAPSDISLTMDGRKASSWKKGDVRLIGKGVAHETVAGKMAGDAVIVAIR